MPRLLPGSSWIDEKIRSQVSDQALELHMSQPSGSACLKPEVPMAAPIIETLVEAN